ncbi:MAG: hypothetical protein WC593_06045 [Methanoregula sp.]
MIIETGDLEINFQTIIDHNDLSSDTKNKLSKSKIILLPASFSTYQIRGDFPSETPNFLKYIRIKHPEVDVNIFENSGEERIQALHHADIILPPIFFLIQDYSVEIIIGIISAYLYDKFKGAPDLGKKDVKLELLQGSIGSFKIKLIRYEGPISGINKIEKLRNSAEEKKKQ